MITMPSCQSAGTMPDLQTWMNRECKARLTGHTHTHTRLTALFRDYPGEPVPERLNQSGFY